MILTSVAMLKRHADAPPAPPPPKKNNLKCDFQRGLHDKNPVKAQLIKMKCM